MSLQFCLLFFPPVFTDKFDKPASAVIFLFELIFGNFFIYHQFLAGFGAYGYYKPASNGELFEKRLWGAWRGCGYDNAIVRAVVFPA